MKWQTERKVGDVRFLPRLPARWRALSAEVVKFAGIGGVNAVVNLAIFNLLLSVGSLKANVVATAVATTSAYFMNRHWTYRHLPKASLRREYTLFFLFNLAAMAIELAILFTFDYIIGYDRHTDVMMFNVAKFSGLAAGTVFRFWAYRTFVFKAAGTTRRAGLDPPATVPLSRPAARAASRRRTPARTASGDEES